MLLEKNNSLRDYNTGDYNTEGLRHRGNYNTGKANNFKNIDFGYFNRKLGFELLSLSTYINFNETKST